MSDSKNPNSPNNPRVFLELSTCIANKLSVRLSSNFTLTSFQILLRTSELFALVKRDSDTRDPSSTESFLNSCSKEVISLTTTELEESPFTEKSSKTKTLKSNMEVLALCLWQTLAPTPMDLNSSSQLLLHHGSMESTLYLEELLKDLMLLRKWKPMDLQTERLQKRLPLPTVGSFE